jgi:hypothetical protein
LGDLLSSLKLASFFWKTEGDETINRVNYFKERPRGKLKPEKTTSFLGKASSRFASSMARSKTSVIAYG